MRARRPARRVPSKPVSPVLQVRNKFAQKECMEYTVTCDCGRSLNVRAGDAGTTKPCGCGTELQIPPLSVLRESANHAPIASRNTRGYADIGIFGCTIALAAFASTQSTAFLIPIGLLVILVGRVWFAMQILREMAPPNALMVLLVPLMPTIFLFQRLEITWKPFLYGIMGFVMLLTGLSSSPT